jgi:hypothetical protein
MLLLRRYLGGPQDLSITDGATHSAGELWVKLGGGVVAGVGSIEWIKVFRPLRAAVNFAADRLGGPSLKVALGPLCFPVDKAICRLTAEKRKTLTLSEDLTAEALVGLIEEAAQCFRLRPAYDRAFVDWLFAEMHSLPTRGSLTRRLVRDGAGRPLGWHICLVRNRATAVLLQAVAIPGAARLVLDDLFNFARTAGATALLGRLEPQLLFPLVGRRVLLRRTSPALVHSRDREVLSAIALGEALLTRMDGETWMDFPR